MSFPIPFGRYQLLERINVGGMAEVFKAKAFGVDGFSSIVAIKRILPNMADDEEFIAMFRDEAKISVQLAHANIVHVYEFAQLEKQYYIAMEYVAGKDLRQLLDRLRRREGSLPLAAVAYITTQICHALDFAHNKTDPTGRPLNVIHRDVSPQNVLLSYEGAVKITDFGIVKADNRGSRTQAGVLKGKFGYMSPEQVRGMEIDRRSDLFAIGILLYEMVTGQRLFIGESDFSTLERVRNAEVTPPTQHVPSLDPELEVIMLRALARERDDRYQTASELGDALQSFVTDEVGLFGSKRLATLLGEEYIEEIARENKRMVEFMQLAPPNPPRTGSDSPAPQHAERRPSADANTWQAASSERTTIFASADALKAVPLPAPPVREAHKSGVSRLSAAMAPRTTEPPAPPKRRWRLALVLTALGVAIGATFGTYQLWGHVGQTGTLVVTSTPTTEVVLSIDGVRIGDRTPLTQTGVPVGKHTLLASSPGYQDKAYHFELEAGAPAKIPVELEPGRTAQAGPLLLDIASEPTSASVRLGGLPQGVTPLTLQSNDTAHPLVLEVGKPGFVTQSLTVTFAPGEARRTLNVRLLPVPPPAPLHASLLKVRSRPDHATVQLDGVAYGTTPANFPDLDADRTYVLDVTHDGYRPHRSTVRPNGRPGRAGRRRAADRAPCARAPARAAAGGGHLQRCGRQAEHHARGGPRLPGERGPHLPGGGTPGQPRQPGGALPH